MKKTLTVAVLSLAVGSAVGYYASHHGVFGAGAQESQGHNAMATGSSANEPLYWVAPMDPKYKRDKPGKSPMGMDLIPVYADESKTEKVAGTVEISPAIENNLGVKTAQVEQQKLVPRIDTVGYVAFDESQMWQINSRVSGWVQTLNVAAIGDKVVKGQVLFELYSPELVKAQEELLNAKRLGRAALVQGAKERLLVLGVDSEQIQRVLQRGKAMQQIEVKAPADGVVASLNIRQGAYLSPQQTVISGGDLTSIWVDAEVFERQAHWIKSGAQAEMSVDALPSQNWQGMVDYIYPVLDEKTRTVKVRLKFPNPNGELKPNMFANITLKPQSEGSVLTVPDNAIIRTGNMARVVLALGEGQYRSTRVEIGRQAGGVTEVLQGLNASDRVVTSAQFLLDSESSQSADLSRISTMKATKVATKASTTSAWTQPAIAAHGVIKSMMRDHKMLTVDHAPIAQWDWPAMVMNFTVKDNSDLSALANGDAIEFLIEKNAQGQYVLSNVKKADATQSEVDHTLMNHSTMDHKNMDHSAMDHSKMDHSAMGHGDMVQGGEQ
ncbi:efflux RND transporter periplasmic adaptor subunit [Photobacterium swingsii]|uniref:efflux RND transporter periplasmic adaptor subunit n=1 Tax=Photobacterium swingsii TaxID=680026 RepID=UPI003D141B2C